MILHNIYDEIYFLKHIHLSNNELFDQFFVKISTNNYEYESKI